MSRKKFSEKLKGQWTPMFHETLMSPAYRQLSFGARALFTALHRRCVKNNGHVYMSQRDAAEELNHKNRNDIANWFTMAFSFRPKRRAWAWMAREKQRIGASPTWQPAISTAGLMRQRKTS